MLNKFNQEVWVCDTQYEITMGGKGGGTSGTSTVTQNSAPPQYVQDAYQALLARANPIADTPYQQYNGQLVAGLTPDQNTAMSTVAGAQGSTQPYTDAATQAAQTGTQQVWGNLPTANANTIGQYMSPYQQDVINSTMQQAQQNDAIQQSQLMGNAIQSGASPFGGDRAGVAAATLAGQQAMANNQTLAGLNNQNYSQALGELNNQQQLQATTQASDYQRNLTGAYLYPQIGSIAQSNTLGQASAQLQSGALQQQQAQENLNVPYQQFLAQQQYPFNTTNWLAGITEGIGSGSGGTSTGTSTPAAPSTASQLGGLGLSGFALNQSLPEGYGLMSMLGSLKRGGVAAGNHFDIGGLIPNVGISYIPSSSASKASYNGPQAKPEMPNPKQASASDDLKGGADLGKLLGSLGGSGGGGLEDSSGLSGISGALNDASFLSPGNVSGTSGLGSIGSIDTIPVQPSSTNDFLSNGFVSSGGIDFSGFKKGGIAHKNFGGEILPILGDIAGAFYGDPGAGHQAQMVGNMLGLATGGVPHFDNGGPTDDQVLQAIADQGGSTSVNASDIMPPDAQGLAAPSILATKSAPMPPAQTGELDNQPIADHSGDTVKVKYPSENREVDTGIPSMKDKGFTSGDWYPLLAAGLGMMAGTSPYAAVNIGQGGLQGLAAGMQQRQEALKENQAQTELQKMTEDMSIRRQEMQREAARDAATQQYQQGELANRNAQLGISRQQLEMGKFAPVKDVFGNVTAVMNGKTGQITPISSLMPQTDNTADIINAAPSSDPQEAAAQILAESGTTPAQVMSRQDITGRNAQLKAYNDSALSAKKALQELDSLQAQTGKYTPGKVAGTVYGGESAIGMGGDGATSRTEAEKASKNLANAFMQANAGSKGSGIRMVEFDANAVPNPDMTDDARTALVEKNKAIANSQVQRAVISNTYPHMHMANVNAIMDNYEQKNPPVTADGTANPNWMPYKDWLKAGRPDTTMSKNTSGSSTGQAGISAGKIVNGYRYKGGDPNDKSNWEKAN